MAKEQDIVIIKYNAGNIRSVLFALERIGAQAIVTDDAAQIKDADKVIFPGVGEASTAMEYLKVKKLDVVLRELRQPVLGICLGMQLLCAYSEENDTECLGIFGERVARFVPLPEAHEKVPQIGWNTIHHLSTELFTNVAENSYCYFVHGYAANMGVHTIATTDYIHQYSSALRNDNFYGVQFHPEKSADIGETILKNFLSL